MKDSEYALAFGSMIALGSFWVIQHILTYGYLEFELVGHETYGLILIAAGCIGGKWLHRRANQ